MTTRVLAALRKSRDGAAAVEFALLAPLLIAMVLGIFQVGIWMGTYNSMRSAMNETGRWVTVRYQIGDRQTNIDIAKEARRRATTAPYFLDSSKVTTYVSDATTQSIDKVTEKELKIVYSMPNVLQFVGMRDFQVSYSRPLFVKAGT